MNIEEARKTHELRVMESSTIQAIGYNEEERTLVVKFKSGGMYLYYEVKKSTYNDFLNAEAPGRFFFKNIKNKNEFIKLQAKPIEEKIEEDEELF